MERLISVLDIISYLYFRRDMERLIREIDIISYLYFRRDMERLTAGVIDIISYPSQTDKTR